MSKEVGDREFHVWLGPFTGTVWAGMMKWNGQQWEAVGKKHDITNDVACLFASQESRDLIGARVHPSESA